MDAETTRLTIRREATTTHQTTEREMMVITTRKKAMVEDIRETTMAKEKRLPIINRTSTMRRKPKSL